MSMVDVWSVLAKANAELLVIINKLFNQRTYTDKTAFWICPPKKRLRIDPRLKVL